MKISDRLRTSYTKFSLATALTFASALSAPATRAEELADALADIHATKSDAPSLETAEAWKKIADKEDDPDGNRPNDWAVLRAYDVLQAADRAGVLYDKRDEPDIKSARFMDRILPIYQAAADAIYDSELGNDRIASLIALGEAERVDLIETSADGCSPVTMPFSNKKLKDHETIVYPIVGKRRLYVIFGNKSGWWITVSKTNDGKDIGASALGTITVHYSEKFQKLSKVLGLTVGNGDVPDWDWKDGEALYNLILFRGLGALPLDDTDAKKPAPVIIMSPDPILRTVPWSTLSQPGSQNPKPLPNYVVAHYAIATVPALSYIRPAANPGHGQLLAMGANRDTNDPADCQAPIAPDANPEDKEFLQEFVCELAFSRISSHVTLGPIGTDFVATRINDALKDKGYSAVIIASHAIFSTGKSFFNTKPEKKIDFGAEKTIDQIDFVTLSADVLEKKLRDARFDLLILLACSSAKSDGTDIGLAGAAVQSGASTTFGTILDVDVGGPNPFLLANSSALPTAWNVLPDPQAPGFLNNYYQGFGAADSLRKVQYYYMKLQFSPDRHFNPHFSQPAAWGSYEIVGWWR